jgi:PAS domain S-box-containing protein
MMPLRVTACYVACSVLYFIIDQKFIHSNAHISLWIADFFYIVITSSILYFLLSGAQRLFHSKESALRESEDRLARILETNASGIVVFDRNGAITYANRTAEVILGKDRGRLIGKRYDDSEWGQSDANGVPLQPGLGVVGMVQATRMPVHDFQMGLLNRDGSRIFLTVNAVPLHDASGEMAGIVTSFFDITERKKAEELRLRKLLLAVEQAPIAIVITDSDGIVEYANPRYTFMTGYETLDVVGKQLTCTAVMLPALREEIFATTRSGDTWRGEIACRRKNGEPYWEYASISPIRTEEGKITALL